MIDPRRVARFLEGVDTGGVERLKGPRGETVKGPKSRGHQNGGQPKGPPTR